MQQEKNKETVLLKFRNIGFELKKAAIDLKKETVGVLNKNNWFVNLPQKKKTVLAKYAQLRIGQNFVEQNLKQAHDSFFSQNIYVNDDSKVLGGFHLHLLVFP